MRTGRPGATARLAPHRLAPPVGLGQPAADQRRGDLARGVRAAHPVVVVVDGGDLAVQRVEEHATGALHLGQLGHRPILARRWNSRAPAPVLLRCGEDPGARARAARPTLAEHRRRRPDARGSPRQDRPARLLDVLLRQLPARARRAAGAGGALRRRAGDDRGALAEVRARGGSGRRRGRGGALRGAPPRARRPRVAHLGRLRRAGVADARRDRPAGLRRRADVRGGPRARARRAHRRARRRARRRVAPRGRPVRRAARAHDRAPLPRQGHRAPRRHLPGFRHRPPPARRAGARPGHGATTDRHRRARAGGRDDRPVQRAAGSAPAPGRRRARGRQRQPRLAPGPARRRRGEHRGGHRCATARPRRAGRDRGRAVDAVGRGLVGRARGGGDGGQPPALDLGPGHRHDSRVGGYDQRGAARRAARRGVLRPAVRARRRGRGAVGGRRRDLRAARGARDAGRHRRRPGPLRLRPPRRAADAALLQHPLGVAVLPDGSVASPTRTTARSAATTRRRARSPPWRTVWPSPATSSSTTGAATRWWSSSRPHTG